MYRSLLHVCPVGAAPTFIPAPNHQDQRLRPWARSGVTSCRSVRSSPTTGVGPRPTVSGSACAPALVARSSPRGAARAALASQPDPVLPAAHRMHRRTDFTAAVRTGRRAPSPTLVLHVLPREGADPARVGLIVSKGVGGSVVRHQVARRLRGVCADRMVGFQPGDLVVLRALPAAARASSQQLADDLEHAMARLRRDPLEAAAS